MIKVWCSLAKLIKINPKNQRSKISNKDTVISLRQQKKLSKRPVLSTSSFLTFSFNLLVFIIFHFVDEILYVVMSRRQVNKQKTNTFLKIFNKKIKGNWIKQNNNRTTELCHLLIFFFCCRYIFEETLSKSYQRIIWCCIQTVSSTSWIFFFII